MQPGWLKQYFQPKNDEAGEQALESQEETTAGSDVSRRDFVKTGFVAGVAAGVAAGTVEIGRAHV